MDDSCVSYKTDVVYNRWLTNVFFIRDDNNDKVLSDGRLECIIYGADDC